MDAMGIVDVGLAGGLGGVLGGLFRLAPEVMKIMDRKFERAHELAMQRIALDVERLRGANREAELSHQNEGIQLEALIEAVKGQAQITGNKVIDVINATVRPAITYWFLALYSAVKISGVYLMSIGGMPFAQAIMLAWTPTDVGMFAGILSFWFLNRTFVKR